MGRTTSQEQLFERLRCSSSLPLDSAPAYCRADFKLLKFRVSGYPENQIKQLYVAANRIGWLFPLQSLVSSDHDFADNPHFLRYASVAIEILAEQNDLNEQSKEIRELNDCEEDNVVMACLYAPNQGDMSDHSVELALLAVGLVPHRPHFSIRGQMSFEQCSIDDEQSLRISASDKIQAPEYIFSPFSSACSDGLPVAIRFFCLC